MCNQCDTEQSDVQRWNSLEWQRAHTFKNRDVTDNYIQLAIEDAKNIVSDERGILVDLRQLEVLR